MWSTLIDSWFKHCIALFFLTFLHEDVAIIAAAFSRVEHGLPIGYAFISLYLGVIAGDTSIYGMGRLAQKSAWLRSKIIGPRTDQVKHFIEGNFVRLVALCRITPGILFPTFVACGWFRMPFKRFIVISLITTAIYTPIALAVVTLLGEAILYKLGYWSWGLILLLVLLYPVRKLLKTARKNKEAQYPELISLPFLDGKINQEAERKKHHKGMPSLRGIKHLVSFGERLPSILFYFPVGLRWLGLSFRYLNFTLPTVANPLIETGGLWGESKSNLMDSVGNDYRDWLARYISFTVDHESIESGVTKIRTEMAESGLDFPVVIKPDVGREGYGVRKINNEKELHDYLSAFPKNNKLLIQRLIPFDGEAGLFYARMPGEPAGKIFSLTFRYFPYVIGDGKSTMYELIENNPRTGFKAKYYLGNSSAHLGLSKERLDEIPPEGKMIRLSFIGSIRTGGIYRDGRQFITPALSEKLDEIARSIPEFYFGRFDVRFRSTDHLQAAEDFYIIEINGAGSEPIHAWDPEVPFFKLYRELFKTQSLMFRIAAENRKRGFKPEGIRQFLKSVRKEYRLLALYPPSA